MANETTEFTPDDLIILDYLLYRTGNEAEVTAWEKLKKHVAVRVHNKGDTDA